MYMWTTKGRNAQFSKPMGVLRKGTSASLKIATSVLPSFDPAKLLVGKSLNFAYLPGTYAVVGFPAMVVTEAVKTFTVNGAAQLGTYVLKIGDVVSRCDIQLRIDGVNYGHTSTTGNVTVPALAYTVTTATSFDLAKLIPGNTLDFARNVGVYASASGTITEDASTGDYLVDGISQIGSYVIPLGAVTVELVAVGLLFDDGVSGAVASGFTASIAPTDVTYAAPVATDGSDQFDVLDGTGPWAAPDAFVTGNWTAVDAATDGQINFTISALPYDNLVPIDDLAWSTNGGTTKTSFGAIVTGAYPVTGFTNATSYNFTIWAHNANGWSAISDVKARTPTLSAGVPEFVIASAEHFDTNPTINTTSNPVTVTSDGNRLLLLAVAIEKNTGAQNITGDSAVLNTAGGPVAADGHFFASSASYSAVEIFWWKNPPVETVTATYTTSAAFRGVVDRLALFKNVDQTTPVPVTATRNSSGTSTDLSASITTLTADSIVVGLGSIIGGDKTLSNSGILTDILFNRNTGNTTSLGDATGIFGYGAGGAVGTKTATITANAAEQNVTAMLTLKKA